MKYTDFTDDKEKMRDFSELTKEEFLESYSYLTEEEYELTKKTVERNKMKASFERRMNIEMITNNITLDERFDDEYSKETTLYFIAPKEILDNFFPKGTYLDAVSTEIAIEVPTDNMEAMYAGVSISPTRKEDETYEDYDWTDVDISYEEIEALFAIAGV